MGEPLYQGFKLIGLYRDYYKKENKFYYRYSAVPDNSYNNKYGVL